MIKCPVQMNAAALNDCYAKQITYHLTVYGIQPDLVCDGNNGGSESGKN